MWIFFFSCIAPPSKWGKQFKGAEDSLHLTWPLAQTMVMLPAIFLLNKKNIQMLLILLPWQTALNR